MKTKNFDKLINSLTKRIQSLIRKGNNGQSELSTGKLSALQSDLKVTSNLQQEIEALKDTLKTKKKELAAGVAKLEKGRKEIKKDLMKERKVTAAAKKQEKQKKVTPANSDHKKGNKNKSGKTKVSLEMAKA